MKLRELFLTGFAVITLGACTPIPIRDCPVFYHTGESEWFPGKVGSTYQYASPAGEKKSYQLNSIVPNEPYEASNTYGKSELDVWCQLSLSKKIVSSDNSHGFDFTFSHVESVGIPVDEQVFQLRVYPFTPDNPKINEFSMTLLSKYLEHNNYTDYSQTVSYSPTRIIDGKEYSQVLELVRSSAIDLTEVVNLPDAAIRRVVIARGYGMIQFERDDGKVFTLQTDITDNM